MSGLLLASAVAVLVWAPASDSARNARASLMIGKIHADFSDPDRATTYSLPDVSGAAGTVTYSWTLTITPPTGQVDGAKSDDPGCNNHGLLADTEPTFVWHHGNSGDQLHDDGCNHDIYGRWGHQGLITVVVKDGTYYGVCSATYKGSFSTAQNEALGQDAASAATCGEPPPPPPPPPPPTNCKCTLLTVRVVPGSVQVVKRPSDFRELQFTLHWVLGCSKGKGGCKATLRVLQPPKTKSISWRIIAFGSHATITCKGSCSEVSDGGAKIVLEGDLRYGAPHDPWKNARIPIRVKRTCQGRKAVPINLVIALDATGDKVDVAKSKLR